MKPVIDEYRAQVKRAIECLPMSSEECLFDRRLAALERFETLGFPHQRLESWRYTPIDTLLDQNFATSPAERASVKFEIESYALPQSLAARLVLVDGLFQPDISECRHPGVSITGLRTAMARGDRQVLEAVGNLSGLGDDGFAALNLASFQDGVVLRIQSGVKLDHPIELLHLTTHRSAGCKLPIRHLILVDDGAQAEVVERLLTVEKETSYFNHLVYEISLAERAQLSHKRIQMESTQAYHLSELHIALQGESGYRGVSASLGAVWSRTYLQNRFTQSGADCELDGLYLVGDGQLSDFHLDVDHQVPQCRSRENFKGIVRGSGRAVFDGLIEVGRQAQKSEAHLHNANLMLSRRGEVDTRPQLMILADDVVCSHGTTVGQLDEEALFYLRSRGLNAQQARRLLCQGFMADVVARFEHQALKEILNERMGFGESLEAL
jgi:Fe-S cluster assembly protein SufD